MTRPTALFADHQPLPLPLPGRLPDWLDHPEPRSFRPKRRYRTVWISDIHLGTRGCNAELLLDFLRSIECDTLYLVGDILDGWRLRKGWYWPDAHNEMVRRLLKLAHRGTRVVLIAGNHDEMLRPYAGMSFGGVEIALDAVHITADGRRLLVIHGDSFDAVVLCARWLALLGDQAYATELITPQQFRAIPLPGYNEIRLALAPRFGTRRALGAFAPDVVHIATEGPIGWSARSWCQAHGVPFTTAFHTRFPDYAAVRTGLDAERFWPLIRRFHAPSRAVLVSTPALGRELEGRGLNQWRLWSRGIDPAQFHPRHAPLPEIAALPGPVQLYVGRVAVEKNLPAFLETQVPGTKVVVGEGPDLALLRARFPDAHFLGALSGEALARAYCSADVFVFPSRTDTFGLVMIEALACGVPVAAYPVAGPLDVIGAGGYGPDGCNLAAIGALDEDLVRAIERALELSPADAAGYGAQFNWDRATDQFLTALCGSAAAAAVSPPFPRTVAPA